MDFDNRLKKAADIIERLQLPVCDIEKLSFAETSSAGIRAYIASLPYTNPPELCKRLYTSMPEVAKLDTEPGRKLAILDQFRPVVFGCVDKLTANITLNEKTARSISLAQALLRHLAAGYKTVAATACRSEEVVSHVAATSIHGALMVMGRILLNCWQCYIAPPENFWLELHSLYRLARLHQLDSQAVLLDDNGSKKQSTLISAYLKPLLLSCANPGHYTAAELKTIFVFLDKWATLAELTPSHEEGLFVLDTEGNSGPLYASRVERVTSKHVRLRTRKLVNALENQAAEMGKSGSFVALPDRIVRNLCTYWSEERVRTDEHTEDDAQVTVVLGLNAMHRLLSKSPGIEEFLTAVDKAHHGGEYQLFTERKSTYEQDMMSAGDVWHGTYDSDDHFSETTLKKELEKGGPISYRKVERQPKARKKPVRGYVATRINTSERGACVEFRKPPSNLSPGELIGIKMDDGDTWTLGIIRWVHVTTRMYRLAGIELLQGQPEPCAACVLKIARPVSPYLPGLLYKENQELIVPSMPFKERNRVRILSMSAERDNVGLQTSVDSTFHLSRFRLEERREKPS